MGLEAALAKNNLRLIAQIAKGWTSFIYLAEDKKGKKFVLKLLRDKSNRREMAKRETENLKIANSVGVGPGWVATDEENNAVVMEFIEGVPFTKWLEQNPGKEELENFLDSLLEQAAKLDSIGLDHGQLAGKGHNILVRKGMPVIIDFEKASRARKVHNVKVLQSFLFKSKHSSLVRKIKEILNEAGTFN